MANKPRDLRRTLLRAFNQQAARVSKLYAYEWKQLKQAEGEDKPITLNKELNAAFELLANLAETLFKVGGNQHVVDVSPEGVEDAPPPPEVEDISDDDEATKAYLKTLSKRGR